MFVGIKGLEMDIGSWAESKDIKSSEGRWILMEVYKLVVWVRSLVMRDWEYSLRRNTFSAK